VHPARVSWVIARRQSGLGKTVCDIAWKAQLRLWHDFRRLATRRVPRNKVIVAVARALRLRLGDRAANETLHVITKASSAKERSL